MSFSHAEASANIIKFATEGRLVQSAWQSKKDGREVACLLGAIHPSVRSASQCNGDLMPMWLAELTPIIFDKLPSSSIKEVGLRYGSLVAQWHVITPVDWNNVLNKFLIYLVDSSLESAAKVASEYIYWPAIVKASKEVLEAIKRGDTVRLNAAARAAYAAYAAYAAARGARGARAARAAAYAAYAAARAAAYAAAYAAADAAAYAAYAAVYAADPAAYAAYAAADAAYAADAALKMFNFIMDQIELEIKGNNE